MGPRNYPYATDQVKVFINNEPCYLNRMDHTDVGSVALWCHETLRTCHVVLVTEDKETIVETFDDIEPALSAYQKHVSTD